MFSPLYNFHSWWSPRFDLWQWVNVCPNQISMCQEKQQRTNVGCQENACWTIWWRSSRLVQQPWLCSRCGRNMRDGRIHLIHVNYDICSMSFMAICSATIRSTNSPPSTTPTISAGTWKSGNCTNRTKWTNKNHYHYLPMSEDWIQIIARKEHTFYKFGPSTCWRAAAHYVAYYFLDKSTQL